MSQYHGSSYCGSTAGYKIFCEKEKVLASMFYKNQSEESEREYALKKYIEENNLKISLKELENQLKQYAMEHAEVMEKIASQKEIKLQELSDKRETDRENHERQIEQMKLKYDIESKNLDIKK